MSLAARIGSIAAARPIDEAPPELPQLIDGLQGWISTTKGRFRFGDGTSTPGHGKAVHEARNVQDQAALFSQATAGLRPTWDVTTFDVPCIRSDGTQYLTRDTALPAPGLVIVGCAFDSGITGFHALTGARSTETPGGSEPREDAWHLNKAHPIDTLRVLTATSSGQMFADTPQILGEKLLVMLEIVGDALQVWQVGATGEQTIAGTRIAADGEQALLARYFDDAVMAIMQGAIFEFAQYAPAPSRAERRMLVEYFQDLIWPASSAPVAATVDAGQIEQGQSTLVDVVTPSSGTNLMLASIDEQPGVGSLSISGNNVQISVPSIAPLGNASARYCLRSDVAGARLVDFGRVDFEVVEGAPPPPPPPPPPSVDLPFFGQYYGNSCWGRSAGELEMSASSAVGTSQFFHAERTGIIDQIRFNRRTGPTGYSAGNGGTYTVEIRIADPNTKLPITTGSPICQVTGYNPGNPGNASTFETLIFTTTGLVVAKNPYCIVWRNTHASPSSNYISMNNNNQYIFADESDPANYGEPTGTHPTAVGSSPVGVSTWNPVFIDGTIEWYPLPTGAKNGQFIFDRMGYYMGSLRYSDGLWVGPAAWGGEADYIVTLSSTSMFRERFRVTRANRTVGGVFMRVYRLSGTTGNLIVTLESGPASDTSGNGTQIEQVTVSANVLYDVGSGDNWNEKNGPADRPHHIWVPFSQPRMLQVGSLYNLRLHTTGGLSARISGSGRADGTPGFGVRGSTSTWGEWEAGRETEWTAWEDSRGMMQSSSSGSTWQFSRAVSGAILSPILFKCV